MAFFLRRGLVWRVVLAALWLRTGPLRAELDTDWHLGSGEGVTVNHGDGSYTIYDTGEAGGDLWSDGDSFQYLYDSQPWTGDFSARVRVVSQTELATEGRWGKAGIRATSDPAAQDSANAMVQVHTGPDSTEDDPRLAGRRVAGQAENVLEIGLGRSHLPSLHNWR